MNWTSEPGPGRARTYRARLDLPLVAVAENDLATQVVMWYDPHLRAWTVYLANDAGDQIGAVEYGNRRADAEREARYLAEPELPGEVVTA